MKGSPEVIDALNAAYRRGLAIEEQAHCQEHWYEARGFKPSQWWHCIEEEGHRKVKHFLMNRICNLEGTLQSRYEFPPRVYEIAECEEALASMIQRLNEWHADYVAVCEAAEPDDDYVTQKMAWDHQEWIEEAIRHFENRLACLRAVGLKQFMLMHAG